MFRCPIRKPLFAFVPIVVIAAATTGCAKEPDNIRFGESVRHMITVQTTDPNATATGLDGYKSEAAIRAYRGATANPQAVEAADIEF